MPVDESTETPSLSDIGRKIVHDVRGPIINVHGLSDQLCESIGDILEIMRENAALLPQPVQQQVEEIYQQGVIFSMSHLQQTLQQLDERVDRILPELELAVTKMKSNVLARQA